MGKKDNRIDSYIAGAAPFARPILAHLRSVIHRAVPGVQETLKWGMPHFEHHGLICSMAAFKEHCAFGFWKASLMADPEKILRGRSDEAMGQLGRIGSAADLPADRILVSYLKQAARLNEEGVKRPARRTGPAKPLPVPSFLRAALAREPKALKAFRAFSPSARNDYIEWITEAKTEATRKRRMATAVAWMAEGKQRNWKYQKR